MIQDLLLVAADARLREYVPKKKRMQQESRPIPIPDQLSCPLKVILLVFPSEPSASSARLSPMT